MVLFIDANIILDVLLDRKGFAKDSSIIWKLCETKTVHGYISTLTFANLVYVMRKELDPEEIEKIFEELNLIFDFAELNSLDLSRASELKWNDFEDALQSVSAQRIKADFIVTRNTKDFSKSKVTALTPSEIIDRI